MNKSTQILAFKHLNNSNKTQIAARVDGVQFHRSYGFNGFGKGWSKWEVVDPKYCVHFEEKHFSKESISGIRLPKIDAPYTRCTFYETELAYSGKPLVMIHIITEHYNDNDGAYQMAYGVDEDGNYTADCNRQQSNTHFVLGVQV